MDPIGCRETRRSVASEGGKPHIGLAIERVPAILDLVQHEGLHAVLALGAIQSSGNAAAFCARPIGPPRLKTTLWIATSAQRPRGHLLDQTSALLRELSLRSGSEAHFLRKAGWLMGYETAT